MRPPPWSRRSFWNWAFAWALLPGLERLYPDRARRAERVLAHLDVFNSNPYLAPLGLGVALRLEAEVARGAAGAERRLERLLRALRGTLGSLGDQSDQFGKAVSSLSELVEALEGATLPDAGAPSQGSGGRREGGGRDGGGRDGGNRGGNRGGGGFDEVASGDHARQTTLWRAR